MISCCFIFSEIVSSFTVNVLTIAQYRIVKSPLATKFKYKSFLFKFYFSGFLFCLTISILVVMMSILSNNFQQTTRFCIQIGFRSRNYVNSAITFAIGTLQFVSSI